MANRLVKAVGLALAIFILADAQRAATQPDWQPIPSNSIFQTGDTWMVEDQTYRLYGVQACIRGTTLIARNGIKRDCGDASLQMLTGLVIAWKPRCAIVAIVSLENYVVCYADITTANGPRRVELGTALISSGFAFAALNKSGGPVSNAYWAAEREAEETRAGLWAYPDLPNPNQILLNAVRGLNP